MMKSKNNYYFFDIYSQRASLYYNNHERIGTYFGLFLTIIYVLSSLIIFIIYLIRVMQRLDITIYGSTMYSQEMPSVNINNNNFYFAFGLEDPINTKRFIDESIYYPQIIFLDNAKINGEFQNIYNLSLDYERCNVENFGNNYQHLIKSELNNSYCLKNFNQNLKLAGGYKYEEMSYITIKIFPCKNTSENKNHCKPQKEIDNYLTTAHLSILIKDLGLNPSNYSFPVIPTFQDLFFTIDKRLYQNYILNFGITEIHTDIGLFTQDRKIQKYLQFRQSYHNIFLRETEEDIEGNDLCVVQLKLDDTIVIHTRQCMKIYEVFSKIGGLMQLIYTIFQLISILVNKFNLELKIINSIFKFNLQQKKMGLKFKSLDIDSKNIFGSNKHLIFSSKKTLINLDNNDNSKQNLFTKKNISSSSFSFKVSGNKNIMECHSNKIQFPKNNNLNNEDIKRNTLKSNENFPKVNSFIKEKDDKNETIEFNDNISLNLINYFCHKNKKKDIIELFNLGNYFLRKRMDIVHVFSLLLITEKIFLKTYKNQIYSIYKENQIVNTRKMERKLFSK